MNRRQFLKTGSASAVSMAGLPLLDSLTNSANASIAVNDFKTLVCVFLDGGNDSFNMLVPSTIPEHAAYIRSRQSFAFERSELKGISPRGLGANSFGLHPNMSALSELFNNSEASFIANAGPLIQPTTKEDILNETAALPTHIGSHAQGRSYWKADHDDSANTSKDGIGGRIASEFVNRSVLPINISTGSGYDLFLAHAERQFYDLANNGVIKMPDYDLSSFRHNGPPASARRQAQAKINNLARKDPNLFVQHVGDLFTDGLNLNVQIQDLLGNIPPLSVDFPNTLTSKRMKNAVDLISIREELNMNRQIIFIEVSGFDTHSGQQKQHNRLMQELSEALSAFNQALNEIDVQSSVLTYTASEFGRTLTNNGDGTDHAWGGNHILMGGAIKGAEIFGQYPTLELDGTEDYNGDGRFIPSTSVTQIGASLATWFGVPQSRLDSIFPQLSNFTSNQDLGFFKTN